MIDSKDKSNSNPKGAAEDLVIASKFPPVSDTSGLVLAKRVLLNGKPVDVVQGQFLGQLDYDFNQLLDEYIDNRIVLDVAPYYGTSKEVDKFREEGIREIEKLNKEYKTIYSRCFTLKNSFLACEYKLRHPNVYWIAEFSDPIIVNLENKPRARAKKYSYENEEFIDRINSKINEINQNRDNKFELVKKGDTTNFLGEYLPYLFADKIIFTNENQQEIMLSQFPYDIRDYVLERSEISIHPTLDEKYYHIKESDYELDDDCINMAYFGTYLAKRNFETIYYALETLDDDLKHKIKFHIFTRDNEDAGSLKKIIESLDISDDIYINDAVPLLEFLNLSTKFDVLIVNDTLTKGFFKFNPFLPSKYSDYLGSGNDIWALCEENSVLDSIENIKYKSYIDDYSSTKEAIGKIIQDKLNIKMERLSIEEELSSQRAYLDSRLNYLNQIMAIESNKVKQKDSKIDELNKKIKELEKENKNLKNKNNEILNSKSWKLTKVLRKSKDLTKK